LALSGETQKAKLLSSKLLKKYPHDTLLAKLTVPLVRSAIALSKDEAETAIDSPWGCKTGRAAVSPARTDAIRESSSRRTKIKILIVFRLLYATVTAKIVEPARMTTFTIVSSFPRSRVYVILTSGFSRLPDHSIKISMRNLDAGLKVNRKEIVDPMPRVQQHMRSREIVKFAGIHHE
jgi:hypothetical protein